MKISVFTSLEDQLLCRRKLAPMWCVSHSPLWAARRPEDAQLCPSSKAGSRSQERGLPYTGLEGEPWRGIVNDVSGQQLQTPNRAQAGTQQTG